MSDSPRYRTCIDFVSHVAVAAEVLNRKKIQYNCEKDIKLKIFRVLIPDEFKTVFKSLGKFAELCAGSFGSSFIGLRLGYSIKNLGRINK
jgi:hypothetical protein